MEDGHYLTDILAVLGAAVIVVPLFQSLRLPPVLGYLAAGAVIGPYGLALIGDIEGVARLAHFGVIFLLFTIGLDLSMTRLRVVRAHVFGLGSAQVILAGTAIGAAALWAGLDSPVAATIGGALALSSTAMVLKLLADRGELASRLGRTAFAVLLLQDLAVVPLLALVPVLAGTRDTVLPEIGESLVIAVAAVSIIVVLGRVALRPALRLVAASRSPELFSATALLLVLATGWLTAQAGLSVALGAFLAGLLLAETEYRHQVEADIAPYRGILLGLFFMTVGMAVDVRVVIGNAAVIAAVVLGLLAGKTAILYALGRVFGFPHGFSLQLGLLLAQGGEFGFVIFGLATSLGLLEPALGQVLTVSVALTMAVTPFLASVGEWVAAHRRVAADSSVSGGIEEEARALSGHVIIAGFGRMGQIVAKLLAARRIPYLALDRDWDRVRDGRRGGLGVVFGDVSLPEVLRAAGAARARALVVTLDTQQFAERTVSVAKHNFPGLPVIVRAHDLLHVMRLEAAGATQAIAENFEASLQMAATALKACGIPPEEANDLVEAFRQDDYARLEAIVPPTAPKAPRHEGEAPPST